MKRLITFTKKVLEDPHFITKMQCRYYQRTKVVLKKLLSPSQNFTFIPTRAKIKAEKQLNMGRIKIYAQTF